MARVQEVEAAVGEAHFQALAPPQLDPVQGRLYGHHLGLGGGQVAMVQRRRHVGGVGRGGAHLAHHDAGGDVGQFRRPF